MSSNEEYLEKMLQAVLNGEALTDGESIQEPTEDLLSGLTDMIVEESDLEQKSVIEDAAQDELGLDGMILEESGFSNTTIEESNLADIGLEGLEQDLLSGLEEMSVEESEPEQSASLEETVQGELDFDEMMLEEFSHDDMAIEESGSEQLSGLEDAIQDEIDLENMILDEPALNDINIEDDSEQMSEIEDTPLDELDLDSMISEEQGLDDMPFEDIGMDEMALEESGEEEFGEMALEESGEEEFGEMALEESGEEEFGEMALEESGLDEMSEDFETEDRGMDEELSEIHDMLGQSGQDEDIDDEMLALLESVSDSEGNDIEDTDNNEFDFLGSDGDDSDSSDNLSDLMAELEEEHEDSQEEPQDEEDNKKKKKEKKRRKKKGKGDGESQDGTADGNLAEADVEKKPGFFAKLLTFLTETDEDEEDDANSSGTANGELSDENNELLNELDKEDKKAKKDKKAKNKKTKKGKKAAAEGEDGEAEENEGKAAKKKKPKKEKKVKEVNEEAANEPPEKKLSKKKIIPVILFCATITAAILIMSSVVPTYLQKQNAHVAYDNGNYEETFDLLYGKKLSEDDEEILHKSTIILMMDRKLKSYQNYLKMGDNEIMALDALMQGVALYYEIIPEAEQYNVASEIRNTYQEILDILSSRYGLSETDVIAIVMSEDNVIYTEYLTSIIYGISFSDGIGGTESIETEYPENESSETMEDILPEEQEIIDGL